MKNRTPPSRRKFLQTALAGAGAAAAVPLSVKADEYITPSMTVPGKPFSPYGMPSGHEDVKRLLRPPGISPGTGGSLSPIESLEGMITPSGLHFERHHNGVPDIDSKTHKFLLHGLVNKPLEFSMDALMRYPRVSRMHFVECGGNSGANAGAPEPPQLTAGGIHGLVSCSEWTGVQLGLLLDEAGVQPDGKWILAESADAASLSRSVPLKEAHEQGIIALYQNGERLRPEQGYPMRLLMPGWEGNLNVKWLHRIKVTHGPTMAKDETSKYTQSLKDGKAR
ncbi:MAG: molybdopterin-dependent oxidoreductase, partial [Rhizomicrobium sp.]